ncbi:hypothetical protein ATANTOWER_028469 [Ataeniobius toweri]|uniref:Secreted protein n=1 Tax=Ataeniobius toweri TaxID=208326 RepID=A0ABU7BBK0_9TELE|nr:hypothetical protein [Ataeniobius toweri]
MKQCNFSSNFSSNFALPILLIWKALNTCRSILLFLLTRKSFDVSGSRHEKTAARHVTFFLFLQPTFCIRYFVGDNFTTLLNANCFQFWKSVITVFLLLGVGAPPGMMGGPVPARLWMAMWLGCEALCPTSHSVNLWPKGCCSCAPSAVICWGSSITARDLAKAQQADKEGWLCSGDSSGTSRDHCAKKDFS